MSGKSDSDQPPADDLNRRLVAHRGWPARYPENSLEGLAAALAAGAHWLEFDVQLTSDQVPVLVHDADLNRISGRDFSVVKRPWAVLEDIQVGISQHFGDQFEHTRLARLSEAVELLAEHSEARALVEIKVESIERQGQDAVMKVLHEQLAPIASQITLISYDPDILAAARKQHQLAIGWVVNRYNRSHHQIGQDLNPELMICNRRKLPRSGPLWSGDWDWVVYVANSVAQARSAVHRGAALVETDCIGDLLATWPGDS